MYKDGFILIYSDGEVCGSDQADTLAWGHDEFEIRCPIPCIRASWVVVSLDLHRIALSQHCHHFLPPTVGLFCGQHLGPLIVIRRLKSLFENWGMCYRSSLCS